MNNGSNWNNLRNPKKDWSNYFRNKEKNTNIIDRPTKQERRFYTPLENTEDYYNVYPIDMESAPSEHDVAFFHPNTSSQTGFEENNQSNLDYNVQKEKPSPFPSLQYALHQNQHNFEPIGVGLNLSHEYIDHFSCTTLTRIIIGFILCGIIALIISILVVAFSA